MTDEIALYLKKLKAKTIISLIATIITIISTSIGILLLFAHSFISIVFFIISVFFIVYLIYNHHLAKTEEKDNIYKPVVFNTQTNFSFEEIVDIFNSLTDCENRLSACDNVLFFRFNKIIKLRTILYKTDNFSKRDFTRAKEHINRIANKKLNISHWVNRFDARNMMRLNIIYTDVINNELNQLISQNANRNLTRVEGIINIAVVGKKIIIPPLYGEYDLAEVNRYKNIVKFISQVLLDNR